MNRTILLCRHIRQKRLIIACLLCACVVLVGIILDHSNFIRSNRLDNKILQFKPNPFTIQGTVESVIDTFQDASDGTDEAYSITSAFNTVSTSHRVTPSFLFNDKDIKKDQSFSLVQNDTTSDQGTVHGVAKDKIYEMMRWMTNWQRPSLLPNYKNPCWTAANNSPPIACLPYFFLVGTQKSGTTDIHKRLANHPEYARTSRKEPLWLTHHIFSTAQPNPNYYIRNYFNTAAKEIYKSKNGSDYHNKITGDCSVSYFSNNSLWPLLTHSNDLGEPEYTNADYIFRLNPKAKLIVVLREPVERAYSDFLYYNKQNDTQSTFHSAVLKKVDIFNKCLKGHSFRYCVYNEQCAEGGTPQVHLMTGIYYAHLEEFLRLFSSQNILILKLEDYAIDPDGTMEHLFRFLDMSTEEAHRIKDVQSSAGRANARKRSDRTKGVMWTETRRLLQAFYRPYNDKLVFLLKTRLTNISIDYNNMYK